MPVSSTTITGRWIMVPEPSEPRTTFCKPAATVSRPPPSAAARSFTGWTKQPAAEPSAAAALYAQGRTEREIAVELGVSRQRVADTLAAAGVARREPARRCPVDGVGAPSTATSFVVSSTMRD